MATVEDIELHGGHTLSVEPDSHGVTFYVVHGTSRVYTVEVKAPLSRRRYREWDPHYDDPEYGVVGIGYGRSINPSAAVALSETIAVAADFCARLNDQCAEGLAWQEYQRREIVEVEEKRRAEEAALRAEIQEQIQWYVGQKFKLKRKGYKATVFGVIDRVSTTTIYTTSERGVSMTTEISDLTELHIMYDGEKRYTKVFPS